MMMFGRIALALAAPLLLMGCLLQPGKFTSDLTIRADRTFSFTYKGEVFATDPGSALSGFDTMSDDASAEDKAEAAAKKAREAAEQEGKRRAMVDILRKEQGYRAVEYLGNGRYMIDYAISGKLDHNFIYPFNIDAELVLPFIAVELRGDGRARIMAPAYSADGAKPAGGAAAMGGMAGMGDTNDKLDGTFTLSTDAEIIATNNEDGAKTVGAMKVLTWRATPLTKTAPSATVKFR